MGAKVWKTFVYTIIYLAMIILAVTCMIPLVLTLVNATRTGAEISRSFTFIPGDALQENWEIVSNYFNLFLGFWNSLKLAVPVTILSGYFSTLTAFALAVYKFKGRDIIFYVIVVFMMIPGQLSLLGFYNLVFQLKMIDSYVPLIVPSIAASGTVFFLRQYFLSILPMSLLEAGRIDGAKEWYMFHRIAIPIVTPAIATMSIGAFIGSWNSYLMPMLLLNTPKKFPLPVMLSTLSASKDMAKNQGAKYLAVSISIIPVVIAFCFFSKYIISSISAGSVKE
ncbi:MAG: carbohydrate ABC transporter permease [Lachnospiraceae bacterium]|nr:carbohydrate ABC transporter permease [Lachnospiraceae bacterium]